MTRIYRIIYLFFFDPVHPRNPVILSFLLRFLPRDRLWVANKVGYSGIYSGVSLSIHILNLTLDDFNKEEHVCKPR